MSLEGVFAWEFCLLCRELKLNKLYSSLLRVTVINHTYWWSTLYISSLSFKETTITIASWKSDLHHIASHHIDTILISLVLHSHLCLARYRWNNWIGHRPQFRLLLISSQKTQELSSWSTRYGVPTLIICQRPDSIGLYNLPKQGSRVTQKHFLWWVPPWFSEASALKIP